jgi:hypothetical protein
LTEEEVVITITEAKSGEDDDDEEEEAVAKLLGSSLHKFEPKTQTFGLFSRSKLGTFDVKKCKSATTYVSLVGRLFIDNHLFHAWPCLQTLTRR